MADLLHVNGSPLKELFFVTDSDLKRDIPVREMTGEQLTLYRNIAQQQRSQAQQNIVQAVEQLAMVDRLIGVMNYEADCRARRLSIASKLPGER